jgi:hypothetical protein
LGPDATKVLPRAVVEGQNFGIEVTQSIKIDKAGADHRATIVDAAVHLTQKVAANEFDGWSRKDHLATRDQCVVAFVEPHHPISAEKGAHQTSRPFSATTRPARTTRRSVGRRHTASPGVSASTIRKSARLLGLSP